MARAPSPACRTPKEIHLENALLNGCASLRQPPGNSEACLLARCERAYSGYGQPQIFVGVYGDVVDSHFVVKMGASGASALAYEADRVAAVDVLSGGNGEAGKVAVTRADAVAVVDHYGASVASEEVGESDGAVGRSDHGRAYICRNVDAGVKGAFPVKGIDAFAERAGDLAFDGPEIGSGIGANPIRGR